MNSFRMYREKSRENSKLNANESTFWEHDKRRKQNVKW